MASDAGFRFLKLFPATAVGGTSLLKALAGPFPDVAFCPTGGITAQTAPDFLALPNVKVCGGSWLTPADAVKAGDWARITQLAKEASASALPRRRLEASIHLGEGGSGSPLYRFAPTPSPPSKRAGRSHPTLARPHGAGERQRA